MNTIKRRLIDKARSLKRQGKFLPLFNVYHFVRSFPTYLKKGYQFGAYNIAIVLRLPWPYAYFWKGERFYGKLFQIVDSDDYQKGIADDVYYKAVDCLEKAIQLRPNYVEAAKRLSFLALLSGRIGEWIKAEYRFIEYQEKRAQLAGVSKHNFRIIDAGPVFSTVGNTYTLDAWIKSGILGLRPPWRSLILVEATLKGRAANQCLLDYWKPYFEFVEDPTRLSELKPLAEDLCVPHEFYIPCSERVLPYSHSAAVWIQTEWEKQGREPLLQLTDEHRQKGLKMLEQMGIPKGAWFVATHVRESGFKGKEGYRDAHVDTYFESYKEVTARGGWVIRLGDASMRSLPSMPNVFDYALSSEKSDWMDVFLLAEARFMIGTSSGPTGVSHVFGVPIAMTNNLPTAATYLGKQDIFLPRLMRSIKDDRFLNLEELMTKPYNMASWDTIYENVLGVKTVPNTSKEIADLVTEMLDKLDGKVSYTEEEEALQKRFRSLTAEREVMIGLPGFEIQCRLGRSFLNQHQHLLG